MKKVFTILLIFSFFIGNAQFKKGTVYLKDASEINGLIKTRVLGGIKFKTAKDSKATKYDYKQITGYKRDGVKFRYLKIQKGFPPKLIKETINGKISLYSNQVSNPGTPFGFGTNGMAIGGGSATIYYLLVGDRVINIGTRIRKKHLWVFKNCKSLMAKINDRTFKKREISKIIKYYNTNCN